MNNLQISPKKSQAENNSLNNISTLIRKEIRTAALFIYAMAENMNMQPTDVRCLDYLIDIRFATAGELAKATGLTTGATTAMIDRLERVGLVKRTADPLDRRKIIVTFVGKSLQHPNITNNLFVKKIPKLFFTYTTKERKIIAEWSEKMTTLFQDEIKKLQNKK